MQFEKWTTTNTHDKLEQEANVLMTSPSNFKGTDEVLQPKVSCETTQTITIMEDFTVPVTLDNGSHDQEFASKKGLEDYDEEDMFDAENNENELNVLRKEGNMPLDDLLALYYKKSDQGSKHKSDAVGGEDIQSEESSSDDHDVDLRKLRRTPSLLSPNRSESTDEDNDYDFIPTAVEDWKKSPKVGKEYQVDYIPERGRQTLDYDHSKDELIWNPAVVDSGKLEDYLSLVERMTFNQSRPKRNTSTPHVRDNEDALFLISQCGNDVDEAMRRYRWRPVPLASELDVWSEEECRQFEHGLSLYGKDFHVIHHNKVKTKSIGEIVKFYYLWKRSERYNNFNAKTRLAKKRDPLNTREKDCMERLLDEAVPTEPALESRNNSSCDLLPPPLYDEVLNLDHVNMKVDRQQMKNLIHTQVANELDLPTKSSLVSERKEDCVNYHELFDDIVPTLPSSHVHPHVPLSPLDPGINVCYSDPGQFAPVSITTNHARLFTFTPVIRNHNNNNTNQKTHSAPLTPSCGDSSNSRPVQPAETSDSDVTQPSEIIATVYPPPELDILSSDEVDNADCPKSPSITLEPIIAIETMPSYEIPPTNPPETVEVNSHQRSHSPVPSEDLLESFKWRRTSETSLLDTVDSNSLNPPLSELLQDATSVS